MPARCCNRALCISSVKLDWWRDERSALVTMLLDCKSSSGRLFWSSNQFFELLAACDASPVRELVFVTRVLFPLLVVELATSVRPPLYQSIDILILPEEMLDRVPDKTFAKLEVAAEKQNQVRPGLNIEMTLSTKPVLIALCGFKPGLLIADIKKGCAMLFKVGVIVHKYPSRKSLFVPDLFSPSCSNCPLCQTLYIQLRKATSGPRTQRYGMCAPSAIRTD